MLSNQGKFIAIEGGEGSGKDTQIALLEKALSDYDITFTREPGGTTIGEAIRKVLLSDDSELMSVETELLMFVAARAQLVDEVIKPELSFGRHVISNRFALSTFAYQICGRQRPEYASLLDLVSREAVGGIMPSLYILLDVDPVIGLARTDGRAGNNRLDAESLDFHQRVREGYLQGIDKYNHVIIDASLPVEVVQEKLLSTINLHLTK